LTELDNVILTPHSAGTVMEARVRLMELTAANVERVIRGEAPIDVVNGVTQTPARSR
jgi:lactate dehydrogenase-like 2-hydroxyacid dehydrogenase